MERRDASAWAPPQPHSLFSFLFPSEPISAAGRSAKPGPEDALLRRILRWLPGPPGRVLLVGNGGEALAQRLTGAGYQITVREDPQMPSQVPFDGLVLLEGLEPPPALAPQLESFRGCLTDSGTLLLVEVLDLPGEVPPEKPYLTTAELEAALGEAGFCLRREQDWPEVAGPAAQRALACPEGLEAGGAPADATSRAGRYWQRRLQRLLRGQAVYRTLAASREPYRVRAYREGDEEQILDLFAEAFNHHRGPDHWSWQYRSNPWGALKLALAFDDEGLLVAQYAAYPMRFLRLVGEKLETVAAHQVGDTMTRPSVRSVGRGPSSLLGRTARYFFAKFCQGRVAFNYGFNVGNIQRFSMLILKAKRVAPVTFWRRPAKPALRPLRNWKRWLGTKIELVGAVDERWDRFLRQVAPEYRFLVCRDQAYLRWRYFERPGFDYRLFAAFERGRLEGWSVFRREDDRLIWGDALLRRQAPELAEPLLAAALDSPFAAGVKQIEGWFAPHPQWFRRELERLGFESEKEPQDLALMISPFEPEPSAATLRTDLYYTLGDGDLF